MRRFFGAVAILYFPLLFLLAFFPKPTEGASAYWLNLLFFFLYSFPFYCVFLEAGETIVSKCAHRTNAERVIHAVRLLLSVGILLTLIDLPGYLYLALALAVAWAALRILGAVLFRGKCRRDEIPITKGFLISVLAVFLAVCGILIILRISLDRKNRPEPLSEAEVSAIGSIREES